MSSQIVRLVKETLVRVNEKNHHPLVMFGLDCSLSSLAGLDAARTLLVVIVSYSHHSDDVYHS